MRLLGFPHLAQLEAWLSNETSEVVNEPLAEVLDLFQTDNFFR